MADIQEPPWLNAAFDAEPPDEDFYLPPLEEPPDYLPPTPEVDVSEPPPAAWPLDDVPPSDYLPPDLAPNPSPDPELEQAMAAIGLQPQHELRLELGDAPFYGPDRDAAFWFGVLQPDEDDPTRAMAGVLSLHHDEDGAAHVAFAPCATGDRDTCHLHADSLIETAEEQGLTVAFESAMEMATVTGQRVGWYDDWGTPLPPAAAADVTAHTPTLDMDP